jgi:L,D-peptidoglycan transpeptidase YkuD (ErfK/YbiS/YcfS/YnhG family)
MKPSTTRQLFVRVLSDRATTGLLCLGNLRFRCALGRGGLSAFKREGDGATPRGTFLVRQAFYRRDRGLPPRLTVELRPLRAHDGWCDAPKDRNYNRRIRRPYPESAEAMWREDGLYDLVVVLGYNDAPRVRGLGSAIFMHVAKTGLAPTEGCIALRWHDLRILMPWLTPRTRVRIGRR